MKNKTKRSLTGSGNVFLSAISSAFAGFILALCVMLPAAAVISKSEKPETFYSIAAIACLALGAVFAGARFTSKTGKAPGAAMLCGAVFALITLAFSLSAGAGGNLDLMSIVKLAICLVFSAIGSYINTRLSKGRGIKSIKKTISNPSFRRAFAKSKK
ncbi:MAG: YrzE family protein [Oscillospiraceae bacterium]|nr:YrzE family protein [Oscillospiraceae bacterium]